MSQRIAIARVFQETNALSPVPTTAADFARFGATGEDLLARCVPWRDEVPGIWRNGELTGFCRQIVRELPGATLVPLFSDFAVPGGKVAHDVFRAIVDRLIEALRRAAPLDGVYLVLHGAMGVEGVVDPEGDLLTEVRRAIGPDLPLVVSFDLHGFLTPARVAAWDGFAVYRTFPHRDHDDVGARAAKQLAALLRGGARPYQAFRMLPMVLGGYPNLDFWAPMRSVYRTLKRIEAESTVVSASLLCCQPWHDAPNLGWCTYVAAHDPDRAEAAADALADAAWAVRDSLPPEIDEADQAIDRVRRAVWRRRFGTVCISDCSDAVGAGGVGENTALLDGLLHQGAELRAAVPIRDAAVVEALADTPVGRRVDVTVGGTLAPEWHAPLGVRAEVVSHHDATLLGGRSVVLRAGRTQLIVTEKAPIAVSPKFFRDVGIRPTALDAVVVKSWVAFRWYFILQSRLSVWARTRGVTDLDAIEQLTFDVPVHPFASLTDWRPADRQRRGIHAGP